MRWCTVRSSRGWLGVSDAGQLGNCVPSGLGRRRGDDWRPRHNSGRGRLALESLAQRVGGGRQPLCGPRLTPLLRVRTADEYERCPEVRVREARFGTQMLHRLLEGDSASCRWICLQVVKRLKDEVGRRGVADLPI